MRKLLVLPLLFITFILNAQDNEQRAESIMQVAFQKAQEGGTPDDFNPLFEQAAKLAPGKPEPYMPVGYFHYFL